MNIANIKECTIENGPGVRVSLFVSGCHFHCKDCFNSEAWDPNYGVPYTESIKSKLIELLKPNYISGISILGGEPLERYNLADLKSILESIRSIYSNNKSIWLYTGYTYESFNSDQWDLVSLCDVIVDGRFEVSKKQINLRFRGSTNQRILQVKDILND